MDCEQAQRALHDYVSHEVDAAQIAEVDQHLATCAACARRFDDWKRFRENLARLGRAQPIPDGLRERVLARLKQETVPVIAPRRGAWGSVLALAATVAIIVGVFIAVRQPGPPPVAVDSGSPQALAALPADPIFTRALNDHIFHGNDLQAQPPMPPQQQQAMLDEYKRKFGVSGIPQTLGAGYNREQCHMCPLGKGEMPHIAYRNGNSSVSLYVMPSKDAPLPAAAKEGERFSKREKDESMLAWRKGDLVYMMVSKEPQQTLVQLAEAFPQHGG